MARDYVAEIEALKGRGGQHHSVVPYEVAALGRAWQAPVETDNCRADDWRYWIPLVCLFTGARLGEIAQLRTEDVRRERGIWFMHKVLNLPILVGRL